jgi:bifunctional enzyme Fae/Hps
MVDMMNVEYSLNILRQLKKPPAVVVLHRGVDELTFNKEKQIPYHEIQRIKGNYNIMLAIAGADTPREVQRSFFNSADIAVVWKNFYAASDNTVALAQEFLRQIK